MDKTTFCEPRSFQFNKSLKVLMADFPLADILPVPIIKPHNKTE